MGKEKYTGRQIVDAIRAGNSVEYDGRKYSRIAAYTYRAEYSGQEGGPCDGILRCRWQVELVQFGGNHRTICDPAKITICGMPEAGETEKAEDTPGEGEKKPRKKAERFVPPTEEEVLAYCRERGNSVDAVSFVAFYSAKNWMIGKNKMKDWRAAVRTWEQRESAVQSQRDEEKKPSSFDTDEFFAAALRRTYSDSEVEAYMNESGRKARA